MKTRRFFLAAALPLAAILPLESAHSAVIYEFQTFTRGSGVPFFASFSYVAPAFVTSNTTIPTTENCLATVPVLSLCGPAQQFYADSTPLTGSDLYDAVGFSPELNIFYYYYFQNGALGTYGTYFNANLGSDQAARLTVSASTAEPIPEPASWAMMMIGFALVGAAARRRQPARPPGMSKALTRHLPFAG